MKHCEIHFSIDSSSTASSSINNDHIKSSILVNHPTTKKKHSNGIEAHYKSLNIVANHQQISKNISNDDKNNFLSEKSPTSCETSQTITNHHRSHPPIAGNILTKNVSHSIADLSISSNSHKVSSTVNRLPTFHSKLDHCHIESSKKIPLSQSFDWGMLAITNTNLILLD